MNDELLESLLHDDEEAILKFKRERYTSEGASENQQRGTLKHLLAMSK